MDAAILSRVIGSVSALLGAVAGASIAGYFSYKSAKVQLEQAKLSVSATSALAILNQQGDRAGPFFLEVESLIRLIQKTDYQPEDVKEIAQRVNNQRAMLQPHLPHALAVDAIKLGLSFDRLARSSGFEEISGAVQEIKESQTRFATGYYTYRESLIALCQPSVNRI